MIGAALLLAAAPVTMARVPPVAPGLAAFPRIARPATPAWARINAAVRRLDARAKRAARECKADSVNPTSWTRSVAVTMHGPDFLSYLIEDEVDCGGAHPSERHGAIVYDLATGAPVDWQALLGERLTGRLALVQGMDGVQVVTLDSPWLRTEYAARYDAAARAVGAPVECLGAADVEGLMQPMLAWLDTRRRALVVRFDLNHAMQACSVAVAIPAAVLRRAGAGPRLLRALEGMGR